MTRENKLQLCGVLQGLGFGWWAYDLLVPQVVPLRLAHSMPYPMLIVLSGIFASLAVKGKFKRQAVS